jgi:hypothetical protein
VSETTNDPDRIVVACHELGHAVAFTEAGQTVCEIRVIGHGAQVHGYTDITKTVINDPEQGRAFLVAIVAGAEAGARWSAINGYSRPGCGACKSASDLATYREIRRKYPMLARFSDVEIRGMARRLVRARWRRIAALTPGLATRGTVTL